MASDYGRQFIELGQEMGDHGDAISDIEAHAGNIVNRVTSSVNLLDETATAILEVEAMLGKAIAALIKSKEEAEAITSTAARVSSNVGATTKSIKNALEETSNPSAIEARLLCFRVGARLDDASLEASRADDQVSGVLGKSNDLDAKLRAVRGQITAIRETIIEAAALGGRSQESIHDSYDAAYQVKEKLEQYGEQV